MTDWVEGASSRSACRCRCRPRRRHPRPPRGSAERPTKGWRLLVVDDNVDSAEILSTLLRMSGHEVWTEFTGPTALESAATHSPDVILMDIGLPGLNGYEVARRVRQYPRLKEVRLVAMTGYGQESDVQLAKEAGFDEHLLKPVDFLKVKELLTTLLVTQGSGTA